MSIFDQIPTRINIIKAGLSRNPNANLKKVASDLFTPIWSQPPRRNTSQWIDLFMQSPRMGPIHKIASDVAAARYKLYVKNTEPRKEIKDHVFLDLLKKPCSNTEITQYNLLYLTEIYRLLPAGEAFWLIERNGFGVPAEVWIVPPHWVMQTPTKTIPYFRVLPMGNTSYNMIYVDPNDMIWFKEPDPLNPYGRGRGRAEAIGDEMETDEYMSKWAKMFFFNDATPKWVGMMPGADENAVDRVEHSWNEKYGGFRKNNKAAWINWDAKFQKLNDTSKEMDFVESRKSLRDACNQFWNMSGELFGILENSNRSTIDLAYELYAKNTLSIRLRTFDDVIDRQLLPQFDDRLFIMHDNVVPTDKEFTLKRSTEGLKNGGITVDEWRRDNEKEDLPDNKGNILYTPLNMMPTDLNADSIMDSYAQENKPPEKIYKALSDKQKAYMWKTFDRAALKTEKPYASIIKKYFQRQQNLILDAIKEEKSYHLKAENNKPETLINWDNENKILVESLTPAWMNSMESGFNVANDTYGFGLSFDFIRPEMLKWIKTQGLEQAKYINETTKTALRESLAEGVENGESIPKLRKRVSDIYADAKRSRAIKIARTESHNTVGVGTFKTYEMADVEEKEWLTTVDGREREQHAKINGEVKPMGEKFTNGLMHPGDASGKADELVNCRCVLLPVIKDNE